LIRNPTRHPARICHARFGFAATHVTASAPDPPKPPSTTIHQVFDEDSRLHLITAVYVKPINENRISGQQYQNHLDASSTSPSRQFIG
jgi:hypothetical protein